MTATPCAPAPPPDELDPALAAVRRWRRELVEIGGPNTLLWRTEDVVRLDFARAHPAGLAIFLSGRDTRLSDLIRDPAALSDARVKARALRRTERRLWQEHGLASCFSTAGMAAWRMAGSRIPAAPVFLRACELVPRDLAQDDFDVVVGPGVELNPALVELLRTEAGVELDVPRLVEMTWGRNGFDPDAAYREIQSRCARLPGFQIARRLGVGIYPYVKLGMVADLVDTAVADHPLVRAMAGLPTTLRDATPDPAPMPLVLAADASQRAALAAIAAGDDVVVQGAPGTGMTQVVANAVAGLAAQGRSTLLVSHKRAAIDAVRTRLLEVGLDLVTEAHDGPDLRHVHGPITTLAVPARIEPHHDTLTDLHDATTVLQGHVEALHAPRSPWGVSAFQAHGALVELASLRPAPHSRVRLDRETLHRLTPRVLDAATRRLVQAATDGAWLPSPAPDPWRGARITTDAEAADALAACERLAGDRGIPRLVRLVDELSRGVGLPPATTLAGIGSDLELLTGVRATLDVLHPEVFEAPLPDLLEATSASYRAEHGSRIGVLRRGALRRDAKSLVRPGMAPRDLHQTLALAHEQLVLWQARGGPDAVPAPAEGIDEAWSAYHAVVDDLERLEPVLATTGEGAATTTQHVDVIHLRMHDLVSQQGRLEVLPKVTGFLDDLRDQGMGALVEDLAERHVPPEQVAPEVRHVWWASFLEEVGRSDARYGGHDGPSLHAMAEELRRLEARALRERAQAVARATRGAAPCRAVSPHEVGALLAPGPVVDTVIVLEASELAVAQAVSAVSRGRQVVVCGDHQQLPPCELSFEVDPRPVDDVRADQRSVSVLSVLSARLPTYTLKTHHRILDDRLTVALDEHLYVEEPTTVPPAGTLQRVTLEHVELHPGSRGEAGEAAVSTDEEVDRVARLALAHARGFTDRSLGVIALNAEHADRVRERIQAEVAVLEPGDPLIDYFAAERREAFWVKHVDDVQGDTRDDILLTVGYVVDDTGQAGHRFGSMALASGERRVSVAVTRARHTLTVITALTVEELRRAAGGSGGIDLLAEVLTLAAESPDLPPSQGELTDPVMLDLAARLREAGMDVTERAGRGVGPIELAVRDPKSVWGGAVAVESDGSVHAAAANPADREVHRPALLERQGWRPLRVWSMDAFRAPEREVARILQAVTDAAEDRRAGR
ncbi:hypothetical protein [Arsenicicoccus dermatophilus]|uniref:hypothetical protein n=1 Tax=Arsenicicoccus dermatophilus TaxID=1076331 RepID=UPI0039172F4E